MAAELPCDLTAAGRRFDKFCEGPGDVQVLGRHNEIDRAIGCQMLAVTTPANAWHLRLGRQLEMDCTTQAVPASFCHEYTSLGLTACSRKPGHQNSGMTPPREVSAGAVLPHCPCSERLAAYGRAQLHQDAIGAAQIGNHLAPGFGLGRCHFFRARCNCFGVCAVDIIGDQCNLKTEGLV